MDAVRLQQLFLSHLIERAEYVVNGGRLVHYTNADAAFKILTSRQVWLRNAALMNDYSEMRHGTLCLQSAWISPAGLELQAWLDEKWPEFRAELEALFDAHVLGFQNYTYIISLSEHDDDEDSYGRLSMWRAYGGRSGVALVMNPQIFASETDAMGVYSTPVIYRDVPNFVEWFQGWVKALIENEADLLLVEREELKGHFFYALRTFVLATKHPGFREEREWRVFHTPGIDSQTDWTAYEVESIAGAPQHVIKLQLRDDSERDVKGCDPATLVNRLIIGPCESPVPIRDALVDALGRADVPNPPEKIWMSNIPLRHRD